MHTRTTCAVLTTLLVAAALTATACSSDVTTPAMEPVTAPEVVQDAKSLATKYSWTGKYHNDALAFALARMKASHTLSKLERCKVGLAALVDFQKAFRKAGGPAIFDDVTITRGMCEAAFAARPSGNLMSSGIDGIPIAYDISPTASTYMNKILSQVDVTSSVPELASYVQLVESKAAATVDVLEAAAVSTTGSIAVSSADYWTTSGSEWTDLELAYTRANLGDMSPLPQSPAFITPTTRRIIKADVSAAIGVLLYDWWMGEAAIGKAAIKAAAASLIAGLYTY